MQKVMRSDEVRGRTPCCAQTVYGSHVNVIYIYIYIYMCVIMRCFHVDVRTESDSLQNQHKCVWYLYGFVSYL